jgi:hypothetical protein
MSSAKFETEPLTMAPATDKTPLVAKRSKMWAYGRNAMCRTTSAAPAQDRIASIALTNARCVVITAIGTPVVPDE